MFLIEHRERMMRKGTSCRRKGGTSELRCFATRVRANHGVATIDPLALSSTLLTMSGSGSANLGSETLDLALKPQVRMAQIHADIMGSDHCPVSVTIG